MASEVLARVPTDVAVALGKAQQWAKEHAECSMLAASAYAYLRALPAAIKDGAERGFKVNILYILGNLQSWKGSEAAAVRKVLSDYAKGRGR